MKHIKCRISKSAAALVLVLSMLLTMVPAVWAEPEPGESAAAVTENFSVSGEGGVGTLIGNALDDELAEQEQNNGCNIFSVEMTGKTAKVSFEIFENGTLVVAVYNEAGDTMIASGSLPVNSGDTEATVTIETGTMPLYYYLRAFLADSNTLRPLCTAYESPNYTQEMQMFLAMTTDDFDADRVLNLDESKDDNFMVFDENTVLIEETDTANTVSHVDEQQQIYIIENADATVTSLQPGDIFAQEYGEDKILIVKVAGVSVNGTTATITGQETSLDEIFECVKIDGAAEIKDASVDPSTCDEGVEYCGVVDDTLPVVGSAQASPLPSLDRYDVEGNFGASFEFKLDKKWGETKLTGSLKFTASVSAKVHISWSYQYLELKLDYSAKLALALSSKTTGSLPLAYMCFMPVPGVIVEFTPAVVLETSSKLELSGTLKGSVGLRASGDGIQNISKAPNFRPEIKLEGTIFVGFSLTPKVKVISDKIASVSMTAKVGAEVKGTLKETTEDKNASSRHECSMCVDGDVNAKLDLSFTVKLLNWDKLTFSFNLMKWSEKILDFYFSYDYAVFDLTTCPHQSYKVTAAVRLADGSPAAGVEVYEGCVTDQNGVASVFLPGGSYTFSAARDSCRTATRAVEVIDKPVSVVLYLYEQNGGSGGGGGTIGTGIAQAQTVSLGEDHSAAITTDGSLYMWGDNGYGQLGDGTATDRHTPVKIMNNVAAVSLGGYHSAAITTDGNLYMWGHNYNGRLGDGSTADRFIPVKIMSNVAAVSLGSGHSAAVMTDGSLYMWGFNANGQLGDGSTTERHAPVKIMNNVMAVSLGRGYSAAVTTDGSLYTWGSNSDGRLGDGNLYTDRPTPVKIMDNVAAVSLGYYHSAAITNDGSLYMWGWNALGQLGDGTDTTHRLTPVKNMSNVVAISMGDFHSAAVTTDGSLYTWGANDYGQLGDGSTTDRPTPIKIMDNVAAVSLGEDHSVAITTDGSLYMWGDNDCGQLGDGSPYTDRHTPVKIMKNIKLPPVKGANNFAASEHSFVGVSRPADAYENGIASFSGLQPNELHTVYALKSGKAETPLSADNLLFITQAASDENGALTLSYGMDEVYPTPVLLAADARQLDLSGAVVSQENLIYSGGEQTAVPVVTLDGKTLVHGEDYDIEGDYSVTAQGDYTLTVRGINEYTGTATVSFTVNHAPDIGDLNNNGNVDMTDCLILYRIISGYSAATVVQEVRGDINGDGTVNMSDAMALYRRVSGRSDG